jgi:hypothetical protein
MILYSRVFEVTVAICWGLVGLMSLVAVVGYIVWQVKENNEWKRFIAGGFGEGSKKFELNNKVDSPIVDYKTWKKYNKIKYNERVQN